MLVTKAAPASPFARSHAAGDRPAAWLTLDVADNDATVLLMYLATALDRIHPQRR